MGLSCKNIKTMWKKRVASAALACLTLAAACAVSGCLHSDMITQTIYDNKDDSLDRAGAQTVLYNDIDAKETSDQLPTLSSASNSKTENKTDQNLPEYGGDVAGAAVAQPVYKKDAPDNGEASVSSIKQPKQVTKQQENTGDQSQDASNGEGAQDSAGTGTKVDKKSEGNNNAQGKKKTNSGSGKNVNNEIKVYKDYGDAPEIPEDITKVTAVGQAAVIVSILGATEDSTPLVGADSDLLSNKDVKSALSNKDIASVKALWSKDGSSKDLTSVDALVKADPQLCFVMEGDDTLTAKQQQELLDQRILIYTLPALTSARNIEYAVKLVGKILAEGGNTLAEEKYQEYVEWHDKLVDSMTSANKGITGGFNYNTGKKTSTGASDLFTLYISDWDSKARYNDANKTVSSAYGAGVSILGYKESPLCYYMSVGGVVNNAAAGTWRNTVLSGQTAVAWQFSQTTCASAFKNWTALDRSKVSYAPEAGDGLDRALMWNSANEAGLGTEAFPAVVVKTQSIASSMEKDAKSSTGIYHPYPLAVTTGATSISGIGYTNGNSLVRSCIGTQGEGQSSVFYDEGSSTLKGMYSIYVNPQGMVGSWTEGSVESVLESAWVYKTFRDDSYDLESTVKDFYKTFYDCDLDDNSYQEIVDGPKK